MKLFLLFTFVFYHLNESSCSEDFITRVQNTKGSETLEAKTTSLAQLLFYIKNNYFDDHPVVIIYDSDFEGHQPIEFKRFFKDFSVSFLLEKANFPLKKLKTRSNDKRYNYIIFLTKVHLIKHSMVPDSTSKILLITIDTSRTVRNFLKSHSSRFYVNLLILTQAVSWRTGDVSYLLYTHELFVDGSGESEAILLASWLFNSLSQPQRNLFPEKFKGGFKGHRLLISTVHKPPFTIRRTIPGTCQISWDGIDIEIVRLLGHSLNFTPEFHDPVSKKYSEIETIEEEILKDNDVSVAIGGIYQTVDILSRFDSSFPHVEDCASFISLTSTALPKYRAVLGPFQESVWLLMCFVYLMVIVPITLNTHFTIPSLITRPGRLNHMFWFVFSMFTNSFSVRSPLLSTGLGKNSTSFLIGIYWIFTIIITACYTGSIIAFITIPVYRPAVETASQLLSNRYRIGTLDHDGWQIWFNKSYTEDPEAAELLQNVEYVPSITDGVRNASSAFFWPYAFLGSQTRLEFTMRKELALNPASRRSTMHISDECFVRFGVTIVLRAASLYTNQFNKVIFRARQSGLIRKIQRDIEWDVKRSSSGKFLEVIRGFPIKIPVEDRKLSLDDIQGAFLVLGSGILIAMLSLFLEYVFYLIKKCQIRKLRAKSFISTRHELQLFNQSLTLPARNNPLPNVLSTKLKRCKSI